MADGLIGGRYGVAHVGLPGKFFSLPSFLAMFAKHFIIILYFVQVPAGTGLSYMKHEFFTIRHRRSFVGGHFSNARRASCWCPCACSWASTGSMRAL
jgi:NADH dehydrogenase